MTSRMAFAGLMTGMLLSTHVASAQAATYVYVSNADDGTITSYTLDRDRGTLQPLVTTAAGGNVMPMALSPDQHHLYAAIRSEPYRVVTYRLDSASGVLTEQGSGTLPVSMANIDVDPSGSYLFGASYSDDVVSVSPIDDAGIVGDARQTVATGHHAHAMHASPDGRFAYVTNLGDDQIAQFRFDAESGALVPLTPSAAKTPSQTGPRHFVFSPDGQYVYVLGEFSGDVTTYAYDDQSGKLTALGTASGVPASFKLMRGMAQETIPEGDNTPRVWAADIHVTPDGRFVYTSERTGSRISTFQADPQDGKLTFLRTTDVETQPRGFQIDDSGAFIVVTGQLDDEVGLYRIAPQTGELTRVDTAPTGKNANWVEIVTFDDV
ncbi:lactonase family protein [Salinicola halimionae]|uniref:lactonase family protein n=1 Tax=Salinicola halimionae TaxID=1949081 RepID=UPI000DA1F688|nr:lactonase family protein [Salinicola halimionae]